MRKLHLLSPKLFLLLCILALSLTLSVAGVSSQDTPAHGADFAGELRVAVWGQIDQAPDRPDVTVVHNLFQQWQAMYPNVELKYDYIGGTNVSERFTWINTNLLAGTLPDAVMIYFPGPDVYNAADLLYNFGDDLQQANPYSDNATWLEDFPLDGLVLNQTVSSDGGNRVIGFTLSGDSGVTTYAYNKTMFDEVGVEPPQTWGEFLEVQQKLKDAGYTPFLMPTAGPLGWVWNWSEWTIREQLMEDVIEQCDIEEPFNLLNDKEVVYCIATGKLTLEDPRLAETWELMKEWSQYWQEDFLAPPPDVDLFAQGQVGVINTMNLWLGQIARNPNITFEWGTFYQPPVTAADSEFGNDILPRRVGNLGQAGSGSVYFFIPTTTADRSPEKFAMARDLIQYVTAPAQLDIWCSQQPIPCYEPGTPIDQVYTDPAMVVRMRGFFEPGAFDNGGASLNWATFDRAIDAEWSRLFVEYMGGSMTIEEVFAEFQPLLDDAVERAIRAHPEWDADSWE
ncbi:MAG: extracellular solute-binding protein [Anaerolineae bacterium]|nr:extracellular solute-binding protein [Anaerolineae bacterium]NUQ03029.1 extracellular solute-binding protein [Anaerolineae bacterium]